MIRKLSAVLGLAAVFAAPGANAEVTIGVVPGPHRRDCVARHPLQERFPAAAQDLGWRAGQVHHPGRRKQTGQCGKERPEIPLRGQGRCHDGLGRRAFDHAMVQVAAETKTPMISLTPVGQMTPDRQQWTFVYRRQRELMMSAVVDHMKARA